MSNNAPMNKAGLGREIAVNSNDILMRTIGGMSWTTDDVIRIKSAGVGLKIYDDLEQDPMVSSVLMKRKLGLISRNWEVRPGGKKLADRKMADLADRFLSGEWGLGFDRLCMGLLDATLKGYAVAEIIWDYVDGFMIPVMIKPKDQRRFAFGSTDDLRLLTPESPLYGEAVPDRKFILHQVGAKSGDPHGRGLGYQLYFWVFFKKTAMRFWLIYAEKFGAPIPIAEVDETMLPGDESVLLDKLSRLHELAAVTIPKGTMVKFLESVRTGDATYESLVEYCDKMISVAVLGETLTTMVGNSGSRALGDVHNEVKDTIIDSDADLLSSTLSGQLLTWMTEVNYPDARPPSVWRPRQTREMTEAKTVQEKAAARQSRLNFVNQALSTGWTPDDPSASLDEMSEGGWSRSDQISPTQFSSSDGYAATQQDAADHLSDQLRKSAAPITDDLINHLRKLIDTSPDLQTAADRLMADYPAITGDDLGQMLAQALLLGAVTGASEMIDG